MVPAAVLAGVALLRPSADPLRPPRHAGKPVCAETPTAPVERSVPAPKIDELPRIPDVDRQVERKVVRRVAHLLELAFMAFDQQHYRRCMDFCEWILFIDRDYRPAQEIWEHAAKRCHGTFSGAPRIEELKQLTDNDEDPRIPDRGLLRIPDAEAWSILSDVIGPGIPEELAREPEMADIHWKLDHGKYDLHFENTALEDILAFIRDLTGLNILLDAEVRSFVDLDRRTTFHVQNLESRLILKLLLAPLGLEAVVTEERVVLLTTPHRAAAFAAQK